MKLIRYETKACQVLRLYIHTSSGEIIINFVLVLRLFQSLKISIFCLIEQSMNGCAVKGCELYIIKNK